MFLAIINDTYGEVKAEIRDDDEMTVTDYFKKVRLLSLMLDLIRCVQLLNVFYVV